MDHELSTQLSTSSSDGNQFPSASSNVNVAELAHALSHWLDPNLFWHTLLTIRGKIERGKEELWAMVQTVITADRVVMIMKKHNSIKAWESFYRQAIIFLRLGQVLSFPLRLDQPPMAREQFLDMLHKSYMRSNKNMMAWNLVNRKVGVYWLFIAVLRFGGVAYVKKHNLWGAIVSRINIQLDGVHTMEQISEHLCREYEMFLEEFETQYMADMEQQAMSTVQRRLKLLRLLQPEPQPSLGVQPSQQLPSPAATLHTPAFAFTFGELGRLDPNGLHRLVLSMRTPEKMQIIGIRNDVINYVDSNGLHATELIRDWTLRLRMELVHQMQRQPTPVCTEPRPHVNHFHSVHTYQPLDTNMLLYHQNATSLNGAQMKQGLSEAASASTAYNRTRILGATSDVSHQLSAMEQYQFRRTFWVILEQFRPLRNVDISIGMVLAATQDKLFVTGVMSMLNLVRRQGDALKEQDPRFIIDMNTLQKLQLLVTDAVQKMLNILEHLRTPQIQAAPHMRGLANGPRQAPATAAAAPTEDAFVTQKPVNLIHKFVPQNDGPPRIQIHELVQKFMRSADGMRNLTPEAVRRKLDILKGGIERERAVFLAMKQSMPEASEQVMVQNRKVRQREVIYRRIVAHIQQHGGQMPNGQNVISGLPPNAI